MSKDVVSALTGEPVRGVVVVASVNDVSGASGPAAKFLTGVDGRFVFRNMAPGVVTFSSSKTGFLSAPSAPLALSSGQRKDDVRLLMTPGGEISGQIVDQFGEAVSHATVRAELINAVSQATVARASVGDPVVTDYSGSYVIGSLEAGRYIVTVDRVAAGAQFGFDPVFFPSASTLAEATAIDVRPGTERAGVDFTLTVRAIAENYQSTELLSDAADAGGVAGVVKDPSGRGLARAIVTMRRTHPESTTRFVVTDGQGRFQFDRVPPGRVRLIASRPDFEPATAAGRTGGVTDVDVVPSQQVGGITLTLSRSAVLAGRLLDQFGDPMAGTVTLRVPGTLQPRSTTVVNVRGQFQIAGVVAGEYVLVADQQVFEGGLKSSIGSEVERTVALLPVLYPGVPDESLATPIRVSSGADLFGLDIVHRPQPVSSLEIEMVSGDRSTQNVTIERHSGGVPGWAPERATISPDGRRWLMDWTPAGRHLLVASATEAGEADPRARTRLWATAEIESDGATPLSLTMTFAPGARVSGAVVNEGRGMSATGATLRLRPAGGTAVVPLSLGVVELGNGVNGRIPFAISNVRPGRYFLEVNATKGLGTIKSIVVDGHDLQERPLDLGAGTDIANVLITMSDQFTEVSGSVTYDRATRPLVAVLAYPADPEQWQVGSSSRMRSVEVDPQGRYVLRGLPPGDYRVAVLTPDMIEGDIPSMFRKLLPASALVSLKVGEPRVQNLTLK